MELTTYKQKVRQFYQSEYFPIFVFGIAFFILINGVGLQENTDDFFFKNAMSQTTLFSWLHQRYLTWSGRMSVELVIGLMNFNINLWHIINSLMAAFLMLVISKYATARVEEKDKRKIINIFLCCSFFAIYPYVVTSSVIWYTGSFYYLWTTTACLCALLPFYYALIGKKIIHKGFYFLYFITTAYACYMEQHLAIIACFGALTLFFLFVNKKEIPHILIGQYAFALTNILVYLSAPGTSIRAVEELKWYPDYPMLTYVDKLFQAVNWTNRHYFTASNLLFLILTTLVFVICYTKFNKQKVVLFLSATPLVFSLLQIIPFNGLFSRSASSQYSFYSTSAEASTIDIEGALDQLLFNSTTANPSNIITGFIDLFPSIACLTIILVIAVLLFVLFEKREMKFISVILYLGAMASGYILAFSPTIFASRSRVFFIGDILMLVIVGILLKELLQYSGIMEKKYARYLLLGMVIFFGMMFVNYLTIFSKGILGL